MKKGKLKEVGLIKKGQKHPNLKEFKFDSSHLTERATEQRESKLLDQRGVVKVTTTQIPKQNLIFVKRKPVRITPKRPKLRK